LEGRVSPIADPLIQRFYEYWLEKRDDRRYPNRGALDPIDFRYVLGDVVLVEVRRPSGETGGRLAFYYKLMGTNIVTIDGYDLTNKTLEDLPEPEYRERIRETWTEVCETGEPAHYIRNVTLDDRVRRYEVLVLPLASDGENIDMLVTVQRRQAN
jgi:hypothetical protein